MDEPGEHYTKWNKPGREKQIPYDFTHMWNLMNKTELTSKMETDSYMESRMTAKQGGRWGGGGIAQKGKKTHGRGQQCGDCVEERSIGGLNGNEKIQWKLFLK